MDFWLDYGYFWYNYSMDYFWLAQIKFEILIWSCSYKSKKEYWSIHQFEGNTLNNKVQQTIVVQQWTTYILVFFIGFTKIYGVPLWAASGAGVNFSTLKKCIFGTVGCPAAGQVGWRHESGCARFFLFVFLTQRTIFVQNFLLDIGPAGAWTENAPC